MITAKERLAKKAEYMKRWRQRHPEHSKYQREYMERYLTPERRKEAVERSKKWAKDNPERYKINALSTHLRMYFRMDVEDYFDMLDAQNGVCAICGETCKSAQRLSVDHDHTTGEIRGLLCRSCNSGIGYFQDSVKLLKKAIQYLTYK